MWITRVWFILESALQPAAGESKKFYRFWQQLEIYAGDNEKRGLFREGILRRRTCYGRAMKLEFEHTRRIARVE
jgi:hypothetical protein